MSGSGAKIAHAAHKEGRAAYKAGKPFNSNPHKQGKVDSDAWLKHENWNNGWRFAMVTDHSKSRSR